MTIEEFFGSLWIWFSEFLGDLVPNYILPNLRLFAQILILLVVAYVAGRICKAIVIKILSVAGLKKVTIRSWTDDILKAVGYKGTIVGLIGDLVKWFIYIIFFGIIIETIGLPGLVNIFNQIAGFVPRFIVAILVVVVGFLIADFLGKMFEEASRRVLQDETVSTFSGGVIKYSIALMSIIMALSLIGLDTISLMIILSVVLLASVSILILGLRDMIPNFAAGLHLKKSLKIGQEVRIGKYSGKVEKVEPLCTVINNGKTNVSVPNSELVKYPIEWKKPEKK